MPLLYDVDILPVEYPLFSWDDWPESRAALVQDGPTSAFQMACWNAMVMHLAEALEAAGLEWDPGTGIDGTGDKYVYPDDRVVITDGFLHGYQFNRMIGNIYGRLPLDTWLWKSDTSYRGYIGRMYVYQYPIITPPPGSPNLSDIVYPEYFTELVYRMNQFIEIMRGTWPINRISASAAAAVLCDENLMIRKSVPIEPHQPSASLRGETQLEVLPGTPIPANRKSGVQILSGISSVTGKPATARWVESRVSTRFDGEVILASWMDHDPVESGTLSKAMVECLVMTETGAEHRGNTAAGIHVHMHPPAVTETKLKLITWSNTDIAKRPSVVTAAQVAAESQNTAAAGIVSSTATGVTGHAHSRQNVEISPSPAQNLRIYRKTKSKETADILRSQSAAVSADKKSSAKVQTGLQKPPSLPAAVNQYSGIKRELAITKNRSRPGWAEKSSGTGMVCTIGSAWDAPVWENGGLWIRQARTIKILADGSMDLSGSGDPVKAGLKSKTNIDCRVSVPPVMAVPESAYSSGITVACTVDSAWYPPEWINGGLYLRQVYEDPVQNENGELEVW